MKHGWAIATVTAALLALALISHRASQTATLSELTSTATAASFTQLDFQFRNADYADRPGDSYKFLDASKFVEPQRVTTVTIRGTDLRTCIFESPFIFLEPNHGVKITQQSSYLIQHVFDIRQMRMEHHVVIGWWRMGRYSII